MSQKNYISKLCTNKNKKSIQQQSRARSTHNVVTVLSVDKKSVVHSIDGVELIEFITNRVFSTPQKRHSKNHTPRSSRTTIHTIGRWVGCSALFSMWLRCSTSCVRMRAYVCVCVDISFTIYTSDFRLYH